MSETIEADYVVIGTGAMGMAFVDEILTNSDATVAMIDAHDKPGGHWNDAYPYVHLHQPSSFYGVTSTQLGTDRIDEVGHNAGLTELASGSEVRAYYDHLMQRRFLPSGRVQYFPRTHYADGVATSAPSGMSFDVRPAKALVDATYMKVKVPSVRPPAYAVEDGVTVIPPNGLPAVERPADGYVVIGAGKTAFDAVLWLLDHHVAADAIRWVVPRDSWLLNRAFIQPWDFKLLEQAGIIADAESEPELFSTLEREKHFLRIDPDIEPTMYRCATVTESELHELRRVENVIRLGRVTRVRAGGIDLDEGSVETGDDVVHVDCTADGLERLPAVPVFGEGTITLQTVRACQQVFSAAMIGRIETLADVTPDQKNELATVIPHPDTPRDFLSGSAAHIHNMGRWANHPAVAEWMAETRLSPSSGGGDDDLMVAIRAVQKLDAFLADG